MNKTLPLKSAKNTENYINKYYCIVVNKSKKGGEIKMNIENKVTTNELHGVVPRPLNLVFGPRVNYIDLHDGRTETSEPTDNTAVRLEDTSLSPLRPHSINEVVTPYIASEQENREETTDISDISPSTRILKSRYEFRSSLELYIADNPLADLPTLAEGIAIIYVEKGLEKNTNTIDGLKSNREHLVYMLKNLNEIRENVLALAIPYPPTIREDIVDEVTLADYVTATNTGDTRYIKGRANKRKGLIVHNSKVLAYPKEISVDIKMGECPEAAISFNLQAFLEADAQIREAYYTRLAENHFFENGVSDDAAEQYLSELEDHILDAYLAKNRQKKSGLLQRSLKSIANYVSEKVDNFYNKTAIATAAVGTLAATVLLAYTVASVNEVKQDIYMSNMSTNPVQTDAVMEQEIPEATRVQEESTYPTYNKTPLGRVVKQEQLARMYSRSKTTPQISTGRDGDCSSCNLKGGHIDIDRSYATIGDLQKSDAGEVEIGKGPVIVIDNRQRSKLPEPIWSEPL